MNRYLTVAAALLILLVWTSAAQAQDLVGKQAPPINAKEWINAEQDLTLKKLKGKIVFMDFTATW